jgi:alkanesulfonate monooxygenase SsuD/methylene tetrahydromethanopterin reductase-like flavin-dependent oxidoreductase (luciferase family)
VAATVEQARAVYDAGVRQVWLVQQLDYDATVLAAVIGSAVPGLAVGTSVLPINPRHPLIVAAAAQTAQAAANGGFSLGLGLGVPMLEQMTFGISATSTIERLREFLTVLRAINDDRTVDFRGLQYTAGTETDTETARSAAADSMGIYDMVPSYQKVMAREGCKSVDSMCAGG